MGLIQPGVDLDKLDALAERGVGGLSRPSAKQRLTATQMQKLDDLEPVSSEALSEEEVLKLEKAAPGRSWYTLQDDAPVEGLEGNDKVTNLEVVALTEALQSSKPSKRIRTLVTLPPDRRQLLPPKRWPSGP